MKNLDLDFDSSLEAGCGLADDDMWHHSRGHEDIFDFTWSKCRHLPSATWMDILEEVIRICLYYDK